MKHPVDLHVGQRLRNRRWLMGMTQQQLASAVGIKFQQIQKYESGANRVSASRLWDLSQALDVPVSFFFDGLIEESADRVNGENGQMANGANGNGSNGHSIESTVMEDKETVDLIRAYYGLEEVPRRRLLDLAKALTYAH